MPIAKVLVAAFLSAAHGVRARVPRARLHWIGMAEGEVLFRIGKPDHETFVLNVKGQPEETWTYFPHSRDPQTSPSSRCVHGIVVA